MKTKITFKNQKQEQGKPFVRENIEVGSWYLIDNKCLIVGIKSFSTEYDTVIAVDVEGDSWYEDTGSCYKIKPVEVEIIVNN